MNGVNCSIAIGFGASAGLSIHIRFAVPADDSCTTIGCIVSFRFSTNIFQLHWCMKRRHPPAISSWPSGERSAMLSIERERVAEVLLEAGADVVELGEDEAAMRRTFVTVARPLADSHSCSARAFVAVLQRHRAAALPSVRKVHAWYGQRKKLAGVAARRADEARALVRAAVHQHAHRAVVVAHDDQRLAGDLVRR